MELLAPLIIFVISISIYWVTRYNRLKSLEKIALQLGAKLESKMFNFFARTLIKLRGEKNSVPYCISVEDYTYNEAPTYFKVMLNVNIPSLILIIDKKNKLQWFNSNMPPTSTLCLMERINASHIPNSSPKNYLKDIKINGVEHELMSNDIQKALVLVEYLQGADNVSGLFSTFNSVVIKDNSIELWKKFSWSKDLNMDNLTNLINNSSRLVKKIEGFHYLPPKVSPGEFKSIEPKKNNFLKIILGIILGLVLAGGMLILPILFIRLK